MPRSQENGRKARLDEIFVEDAELSIEEISVGPDIEIIPADTDDIDDTDDAASPIGPGLYLLPHKEVDERKPRLAEHFGPELTAGIVILALFVIFVVLMLLDVSNNDASNGDEQPAQTAPVEVIDVEIGEGITLERE